MTHFVYSSVATDRVHREPRLFWVSRYGVLMCIAELCADDAISNAAVAQ